MCGDIFLALPSFWFATTTETCYHNNDKSFIRSKHLDSFVVMAVIYNVFIVNKDKNKNKNLVKEILNRNIFSDLNYLN